MVSQCEKAKRALVKLIRNLAKGFDCTVSLSREATEQEVHSAFRSLSRKVHPDKPGGSLQHFQQLSAMHDTWSDLLKSPDKGGRPARHQHAEQPTPPTGRAPTMRRPASGFVRQLSSGSTSGQVQVVLPTAPGQTDKAFCVRAQAVLLTYQGLPEALPLALAAWMRFLKYINSNLRLWGVARWTATMETNKSGKHHLHLMLELTQRKKHYARCYEFEKCCPNIRANDLMGDAWTGRRWRTSVDRGHFYVWANKIGTVLDSAGNLCVAGNYEPAWTSAADSYEVRAEWPEKLWKAYKMDDKVYFEEYLFRCKDKIQAKKRNFEAYRAWHNRTSLDNEIEQRTQRIRNNPSIYQPFEQVAVAEELLGLLSKELMRFPVLVVHAPSFSGKSEWAASLFKHPLYLEIGALGLWPPGMKGLDRSVHDGLVLDDLRDLEFIHANQEKLQSKYDRPVTLFNTPGGELACTVDLYRLPIVFTINNSTKNLHFLETHDFCSKRTNVRVLCFRGRPGQSLVTETLPEDFEEEGAWDRFAAENAADTDSEAAAEDPYM